MEAVCWAIACMSMNHPVNCGLLKAAGAVAALTALPPIPCGITVAHHSSKAVHNIINFHNCDSRGGGSLKRKPSGPLNAALIVPATAERASGGAASKGGPNRGASHSITSSSGSNTDFDEASAISAAPNAEEYSWYQQGDGACWARVLPLARKGVGQGV